MKYLISVIVPCYNEAENIKTLEKRVADTFRSLKKYSYEIIFIDNASTDRSERVFREMARKDRRVKVLFMSRNFGSPQPSFLAGLSVAKGDAAVLLHGDVQDPPEMIADFIRYWERGYDVAYGVRTSRRGYGLVMNLMYQVFYRLFDRLSYVKAPINAGEFSLIDRRVIRELLAIDEYDYYLRFLRAFVGFRQIGIPYVRSERTHGKSTESFLSGLLWAKTFIVNFSFKPLEWISGIAFFVMILTVILFIGNFALVLMVPGSPRGIPTVVLLILFLGAVQLLSLSVIAEYLAKIFLEVKHRPRYIIHRTLNIRQRERRTGKQG